MLRFDGLTVTETRTAGVTVKIVDPETDPKAAIMFVVPGARLLARPFVRSLLSMVATVASDELHRTLVVRS
jgi:hypothetical protein